MCKRERGDPTGGGEAHCARDGPARAYARTHSSNHSSTPLVRTFVPPPGVYKIFGLNVIVLYV